MRRGVSNFILQSKRIYSQVSVLSFRKVLRSYNVLYLFLLIEIEIFYEKTI